MMFNQYLNYIQKIFDKNQVETILLIIWFFLIFNVLPDIPYLNLTLDSIGAKVLLVWIFSVLVFNIKARTQTYFILVVLTLALIASLLDFSVYESLGNAIFVLLAVNVFYYLRETTQK